MKYSSSIRLINIIVFLLLAVAFGFLGVWFGCVYGPHLLLGDAISADIELPDISVGLCAAFASLGFAGCGISVVGLFKSVVSFLKGGDDRPVIDSFCCYIALGFVIAVYCFLNAAWVYRLTSTNIGYDDIVFVVIIYALLGILAVIASAVPLTRMFGEGNHLNQIMKTISGGLAAGLLGVAAFFVILFFANVGKTQYNYNRVITKTAVLGFVTLAIGLLALGACLGYASAEKHGKVSKLNAAMYLGALGLTGLNIAGCGVFAHEAYASKVYNISFMAVTFRAKFADAYEFAGMSYAIGGILLIATLILVYYTVNPPKVSSID